MKGNEALTPEFRLLKEPRGRGYRALVNSLGATCPQFLLVVREQLALGPEAVAILRRLQPQRFRQVRTSAWPGTELIGHFAHVSYFRSNSASLTVLKTAAKSLYEWRQPSHPEDLCFLDGEGRPVLTTIAHEGDAWLQPREPLLKELLVCLGSSYLARGA